MEPAGERERKTAITKMLDFTGESSKGTQKLQGVKKEPRRRDQNIPSLGKREDVAIYEGTYIARFEEKD